MMPEPAARSNRQYRDDLFALRLRQPKPSDVFANLAKLPDRHAT